MRSCFNSSWLIANEWGKSIQTGRVGLFEEGLYSSQVGGEVCIYIYIYIYTYIYIYIYIRTHRRKAIVHAICLFSVVEQSVTIKGNHGANKNGCHPLQLLTLRRKHLRSPLLDCSVYGWSPRAATRNRQRYDTAFEGGNVMCMPRLARRQ